MNENAIESASEVLRSGNLVHGAYGEKFETELTKFTGAKYAVVVSSGTAALHLSLLALDIGPGDAVIVPDFTFPATASAVLMAGAKPLLVDVSIDTYNIDVDLLSMLLKNYKGPETIKAIMPVHEFGTPANMENIKLLATQYKLHIIEDAACALGARTKNSTVGGDSTLACFSFHPRKTLTTGEGGAITTNDAKLASRLKRLRNHGMERSQTSVKFVEFATNYRLTDFQSALGLSQIHNLSKWIETRRKLASEYHRLLAPLVEKFGIKLPKTIEGQSWQSYMIVLPENICRDSTIQVLKTRGIETNLGAQCLSEIGLYGRSYHTGNDPVSSILFKSGLVLPMYEKLSLIDLNQVVTKLESVLYEINKKY